MNWSPTQYSRFEAERNRPIHDLLNQVTVESVRRALDLGCGPGNSTELMQVRFPGADIAGMDNSTEMIEAARNRLPNTSFTIGDIAALPRDETYDLLLANAALQWVPDHATLLPDLMARLNSGGWLAVQMPDNLNEPAQTLMRNLAVNGPWAARMTQADSRTPILSPEEYYAVLSSNARQVNIWRTTYYHILQDPSAIVEWFKGSGLRPFLSVLSEDERADYLRRYEQALSEAYPRQADGTVLLPFPRLFLVARR